MQNLALRKKSKSVNFFIIKMALDENFLRANGYGVIRTEPEPFTHLDVKTFGKVIISLSDAGKDLVKSGLEHDDRSLYLSGINLLGQILKEVLPLDYLKEYKRISEVERKYFVDKTLSKDAVKSETKEYFKFLGSKILEVYSQKHQCSLEERSREL